MTAIANNLSMQTRCIKCGSFFPIEIKNVLAQIGLETLRRHSQTEEQLKELERNLHGIKNELNKLSAEKEEAIEKRDVALKELAYLTNAKPEIKDIMQKIDSYKRGCKKLEDRVKKLTLACQGYEEKLKNLRSDHKLINAFASVPLKQKKKLLALLQIFADVGSLAPEFWLDYMEALLQKFKSWANKNGFSTLEGVISRFERELRDILCQEWTFNRLKQRL